TADGGGLYLAGEGFRAGGQRPFLDRVSFEHEASSRLFECDPAHLEMPVAMLDAGGPAFLTLRQSQKEPPNRFLRTAGRKDARRLSDFADPAPALTASKRIQFTFVRPDSVRLNAEVVLPGDWTPGTRLPTVFWIYPNDYRSAAAASQNR